MDCTLTLSYLLICPRGPPLDQEEQTLHEALVTSRATKAVESLRTFGMGHGGNRAASLQVGRRMGVPRLKSWSDAEL